MAFDEKIWNERAKQGEVAGIAIHTSLAIRNLNLAIMAIKKGDDPSEYLKASGECAESLHQIFRDLTGYTSDGG